MNHVFTYGSLMYDPVWQAVVAGNYRSSPAVIRGYQRRAVVGEHYPALILSAETSDIVLGRLYRNVSAEDLQRLDVFEGEQYERNACRVAVEAEDEVACEVYIWRPRYKHLVSAEPWDLQAFEERGLALFQEHYRGFDATR